MNASGCKGINVQEFRRRYSMEAGARERFYADHPTWYWPTAPDHIKQFYRAQEARQSASPQPSLWAKAYAILREMLSSDRTGRS